MDGRNVILNAGEEKNENADPTSWQKVVLISSICFLSLSLWRAVAYFYLIYHSNYVYIYIYKLLKYEHPVRFFQGIPVLYKWICSNHAAHISVQRSVDVSRTWSMILPSAGTTGVALVLCRTNKNACCPLLKGAENPTYYCNPFLHQASISIYRKSKVWVCFTYNSHSTNSSLSTSPRSQSNDGILHQVPTHPQLLNIIGTQ